MIMRNKFPINHWNDELLHSCLISATDQFIIPNNRVLGESAHRRVLNQLKISKQQKRQKQKKKRVVAKTDGEHDRKSQPDADGDGDGGDANDVHVRVFGLILGG